MSHILAPYYLTGISCWNYNTISYWPSMANLGPLMGLLPLMARAKHAPKGVLGHIGHHGITLSLMAWCADCVFVVGWDS